MVSDDVQALCSHADHRSLVAIARRISSALSALTNARSAKKVSFIQRTFTGITTSTSSSALPRLHISADIPAAAISKVSPDVTTCSVTNESSTLLWLQQHRSRRGLDVLGARRHSRTIALTRVRTSRRPRHTLMFHDFHDVGFLYYTQPKTLVRSYALLVGFL